MSMLAGAQELVISDYPSPEILATIEMNCKKNIAPSHYKNNIHVIGHEWGVIDDEFSKTNARHFTRILAADCLWMVGEHQNLVASMLHFLADEDDHEKNKENKKKKSKAQVWIVAGFHTGRAKLASFFEVAHDAGLEIKNIWERDVKGNEREWVKEPDKRSHRAEHEDIASLKKWFVVAVLERR